MNLIIQHFRLGTRSAIGRTPRLTLGLAVAGCLPIYLLVHFGLRLLEGNTLRWDESEQTLFSQRLALGYNDQPPVYTWLLWAIFQVTGVSVLGLHLLKSLILSACYLGTFAVARKLTEEKFARLGTLSLLLTPYFAWSVLIDGAHTLFVAAFVPIAFLVVLRLLERATTPGFMLLGIVLGLGVLAKYSFAILAIAILLALLSMPAYRRRLRDPRLLWTVALAGLVILPHALWVHENWKLVSERPMARSGVIAPSGSTDRVVMGLFSLTRTSLLVVGSLLAVLAACFPKDCARILFNPAQSDRVRLLGRWLAMVCLLLIVLVLLGITKFRTHWLIPVLVLFPVYIFARLAERPVAEKARRGYLGLIGLAVIAVIAIRIVGVTANSRETEKARAQERLHAELAAHISSNGLERATIIGDHPIVCGNIRRAFPEASVICSYYPAFAVTELPVGYVAWEATDSNEPMPGLGKWLENRVLEARSASAVYFEIAAESHTQGLRRIGFVAVQPK